MNAKTIRRAAGAQLFFFFALLLCFGALAESCLMQAQTPTPTPTAAPNPLPVAPIERELAGGQAHNYSVALMANQFLRVIVEQRGADVVLRWYAPDGKLLTERDRQNGAQEEESLTAIAAETGTYRLEVAVPNQNAATSKYAIRSEATRLPTAQDRQRINAEQQFQDALGLRRTQKPEDTKAAIEKWTASLKVWRETGDVYGELLTLTLITSISRELDLKPLPREVYAVALKQAEARKFDRLADEIRLALLPPEALAFMREMGAAVNLLSQGSRLISENNLESQKQAQTKLNEAIAAYRNLRQRLDAVFAFDKLSGIYPREKLMNLVANHRYQLNYAEIVARNIIALSLHLEAQIFRSRNNPEAMLQARAKASESLAAYQANEKLFDPAFDYSQYDPYLNHDVIEDNRADHQYSLDQGIASAYDLLTYTFEYFPDGFEEGLKHRKLNIAALQKLRSGRSKYIARPFVKLQEAHAALSLAATLRTLGRQTEAVDYYQQSLRLFRELQNEDLRENFPNLDLNNPAFNSKFQEAFVLHALALTYSNVDENRKAIELYEASLAITQTLTDSFSRHQSAETLSLLASLYFSLFDYQKSLTYSQKALQIYRELNDLQGIADSLGLVSTVYYVLGDEKQSRVSRQEELDSFMRLEKELPNSTLSPSLLNTQMSNTFIRIGMLYHVLGNDDKALEYFARFEQTAALNPDKSVKRLALVLIGDIYADRKNAAKALEYYQKSLDLARQMEGKDRVANDLMTVGAWYLNNKQPQAALPRFVEALTILRYIGVDNKTVFSRNYATILNYLGKTYQELGQDRLAIFYSKQAVNAVQAERQRLTSFDPTLQRSYLAKSEGPYRRLAQLLIAAGHIGEAEQVLNLLKEEEFGKVLRRSPPPDSLLPYSDAEQATLAIIENLGKLGGELAQLTAAETPLSETQQKRRNELQNELLPQAEKALTAALERLTAERHANGEQVTNVRNSQSLQTTLNDLGPGTVALYTLITNDDSDPLAVPTTVTQTANAANNGSKNPALTGVQSKRILTGWVILVTPNFRKAYPIDVAQLNETIANFRQTLSSAQYDPEPYARQLYDKIFRRTSTQQKTTLEQDLTDYFAQVKAKTPTLMWSLDGVLRYVPMAALHDGKQYLVGKYRTTVFTSASIGTLDKPTALRWKALGLGVTQAHEGFAELPGVRRELLAIVRDPAQNNPTAILPGTIRFDDQFTRQALFEGVQAKYPVVHLSTHFSWKAGQEGSFLLLGDGRLHLSELKTRNCFFCGVDLLTLSACNTATSDADNGREMEGLGFVAQQLGAKSVLASLWEISDTGTDELMLRFYRQRETHPRLPKAEAFRQAQLSLLYGDRARGTNVAPAARRNAAPRGVEIVHDEKPSLAGFAPYRKNNQLPLAHPHYWSSFILIGNWR